jgi:uncharacterized protein YybS (DUF2232 family)
MKTYLLYGFGMAAAGFLLQLVLFVLGLHSDVSKFSEAQWIGGLLGLVIAIAAIVLGTQAKRELLPEGSGFSYGQAVGVGVMISLFSGILGSVLNYVYVSFINTGFTEIVVQVQLAKAQAKGMDSDQLDQLEKGVRFMTSPVPQAVVGFIFVMFFGTVLSLVTAAFLKRPAPGQPASAQ